MGKFNWRGAAQGALGSLYQSWEEDQKQKREYTRQDRDLAQQLYAKMLESGMEPPNMPALGPMAEELAKSYRDQLPQAKQKALDEEMDKIYQQETARGLAQSQFEKPKQPSSELQMLYDWVGGKESYDAMANDQKRAAMRSFAQRGKKETATGADKEKWRYFKDESTGKITRISESTGKEEVVKKEDEEKIRRQKEKEAAQLKKQTAADAKEARKVYSTFLTADDRQKEALLPAINATLADIGWKIVPPVVENVPWGRDVKKSDWNLEKSDPLGILE